MPPSTIPPVFSCRAILFDLDGTLVDSAPDLWRSLNHVLEKNHYPTLPLERVRHLVGHGARPLLARGFWGEGAVVPDEDPDFEAAVSDFLDNYRQHLTDHSRPFPGAYQALTTLHDRGFAMAVVTNKPEGLARRMLEQLQLAPFFAIVVGGDTLEQKKPHPEPLRHALRALGVASAQGIMVGDSETDSNAGRAAGCRVVLLSHGYNRGIALEQLNPDHVLDYLEELPGILTFDS